MKNPRIVEYLISRGFQFNVHNIELVKEIEKASIAPPQQVYTKCFKEKFVLGKYNLSNVKFIQCNQQQGTIVKGCIRDRQTGLYFKSSSGWATFVKRFGDNKVSENTAYSGPKECFFVMQDGVILPYQDLRYGVKNYKKVKALEKASISHVEEKHVEEKHVEEKHVEIAQEEKQGPRLIESVKDDFFGTSSTMLCPRCNECIHRHKSNYNVAHIVNRPLLKEDAREYLMILCTSCNLKDQRWRNELDMIWIKDPLLAGPKIYQIVFINYKAIHNHEPSSEQLVCFLMNTYVSVELGGKCTQGGVTQQGVIDEVKTHIKHLYQQKIMTCHAAFSLKRKREEEEHEETVKRIHREYERLP